MYKRQRAKVRQAAQLGSPIILTDVDGVKHALEFSRAQPLEAPVGVAVFGLPYQLMELHRTIADEPNVQFVLKPVKPSDLLRAVTRLANIATNSDDKVVAGDADWLHDSLGGDPLDLADRLKAAGLNAAQNTMNVSRRREFGSPGGKNKRESSGAKNPNNAKSYHSSALPAAVARRSRYWRSRFGVSLTVSPSFWSWSMCRRSAGSTTTAGAGASSCPSRATAPTVSPSFWRSNWCLRGSSMLLRASPPVLLEKRLRSHEAVARYGLHGEAVARGGPVSYTHLTLPTKA